MRSQPDADGDQSPSTVIASHCPFFDIRCSARKGHVRNKSSKPPAFLFDLDGTLIDSVYQHVLAWREALERGGIKLAVWRIHRRIGMSGGLFVNALLRETGRPVTAEQAAEFQKFHSEAYLKQVDQVQPLPGAKDLLKFLTKA